MGDGRSGLSACATATTRLPSAVAPNRSGQSGMEAPTTFTQGRSRGHLMIAGGEAQPVGSPEPDRFIADLQAEMRESLHTLDAGLPANRLVRIGKRRRAATPHRGARHGHGSPRARRRRFTGGCLKLRLIRVPGVTATRSPSTPRPRASAGAGRASHVRIHTPREEPQRWSTSRSSG